MTNTAGLTAFPTCPISSSGNPCAMSRLSSLPTRWAMKSSGRNEDEDKEDFSHDGYGKEIVAGTAPVRGSAGAGSCQGAQSQNAQTHSGGCNSGKGAAGGADDGAVCVGELSDAEAAAARLNSAGRSPGNWGPPSFFSRKGALTHHPEGAVVLAVGKPCALRGGLRLLRQPPDNATAPASAAVIVCAGRSCFYFGNSLLPARTNLPPAALFAAMTRSSTSGHFLFCKRETEKERMR